MNITRKLTTLLAALLIGTSLAGAQGNDTEKYCRPVEVDTKVQVNDKDSIKLFKDEWFEVVAPNKGDAIVGKQTLPTDGESFLKKSKQKKLEEHKPINGIVCAYYGDSLFVKVPAEAGVKSYRAIDQLNNSSTSPYSVTGRYEFIGRYDINALRLRIAPEGHVSSVLEKKDMKEATDSFVVVGDSVTYNVLMVGKEEIWRDKGTPTTQASSDSGWIEKLGKAAFIIALIIFICYITYLYLKKKGKVSEERPEKGRHRYSKKKKQDDPSVPQGVTSASFPDQEENEEVCTQDEPKQEPEEEKPAEPAPEPEETPEEKIERLNGEIENLQKEKNNLQDKLTTEKQKANGLQEQLQAAQEKLKKEQNAHEDTHKALLKKDNELSKTQAALTLEQSKVAQLTKAQSEYTKHITFTPFAQSYAQGIEQLIELAQKVEAAGTHLLAKIGSVPTGKPDYIALALANYRKALYDNDVNIAKLSTEAHLTGECGMAYSGSETAKIANETNQQEQEMKLRAHYFRGYLQNLAAALVALNETLAAAHKLTHGAVSEKKTEVFATLRKQIEETTAKLKIKVDTVRLFEKTDGTRQGLHAELADGGFEPNEIFMIKSCVAYRTDGRTPDDNIEVVAQQ